jgi:hypothetical protein
MVGKNFCTIFRRENDAKKLLDDFPLGEMTQKHFFRIFHSGKLFKNTFQSFSGRENGVNKFFRDFPDGKMTEFSVERI